LFGKLARRVSGIYYALATLAMAQLVSVIVEIRLGKWSGGSDGLAGVPRPVLLGVNFDAADRYLLLVSALFVIALVTLSLIRHSPYGQVLRAIRENAVRAEQLGYNVDLYRVSALAVSGAYSGVAGALFGGLTLYVGPELLRATMSIDVLVMCVLGGPNTLLGPLLGVAIFETSREVITRYTDHWHGLVGAMFILATLFLPFGLVGLFRRRRRATSSVAAPARVVA
jgi:branched-chain amino acid transport system permease protein